MYHFAPTRFTRKKAFIYSILQNYFQKTEGYFIFLFYFCIPETAPAGANL